MRGNRCRSGSTNVRRHVNAVRVSRQYQSIPPAPDASGHLRRMSRRVDSTIADSRPRRLQQPRQQSASTNASQSYMTPASLLRPRSRAPPATGSVSSSTASTLHATMPAAESGLMSIDDINPADNIPPGMILTLRDGKEISFDTEQSLRESLMALASDNSGLIETKTLLGFLSAGGLPFDWEEQMEFVSESDPQNTGYVDITAFVKHLIAERKRMEEAGCSKSLNTTANAFASSY